MTTSRFGHFPLSVRKQPARKRRPTGLSRKRKKQLGFEALEDRRVMSAESPLAALRGAVDSSVGIQVSSLSSNSLADQLAILQRELYWQYLQSNTVTVDNSSRAIPTDPLLTDPNFSQWYLINMGQAVNNPDFQDEFGTPGEDVNVAPIWNQGLFGDGILIGAFDLNRIQTTHPDLAANIHPTLAFNGSGVVDVHATAIAGMLAGVADNGIGITGIAPGATIVPMSGANLGLIEDAFRFALNNDIDIVNNSWGPLIDVNGDGVIERGLAGPTPAELLAIRDSILFGRDNKGIIFVFAAGNDAGNPFNPGNQSLGAWDSAAYDGFVSSRYTIGVTGVDHDGFYNNFDGTVFNYSETSTGVLVVAPTGSFGFVNIADDTGIGSGVVTTDLVGNAGINIPGFAIDRDFLTDLDYTSRFNGTSAAAPLVSGVVALMLQANPNLSWRDVQEILLRSARQNAEFEIPSTVITGPTQNTWIANQIPVFHDPDPFDPSINPVFLTTLPTLDPTIFSHLGLGFSDFHYQPTPQVLTNGSGYTISQGKGVHGEDIGYAHGVVDAELAVQLAQQWTSRNQTLPSERTFTSFIAPKGGFFIPLPAHERSNQASGFQDVPGGIGGTDGGGFIDYWEEYFVDDPFADYDDTQVRGGFVELNVPASNTMAVETVEVRVTATGGTTEFLDNVRVLLVSPDGTHHELNHFFTEDIGGIAFDPINIPAGLVQPYREGGALLTTDTNPGGPMVATFTSNRSWGERSDSKFIFDPTTNEPAVNQLLNKGWQLHMENYSGTAFQLTGIEVVWHGSPIGANTQRIQGLVGVDDNRNDLFNYSRVAQGTIDLDGDPTTLRFGEVINTIDTTHESMGANVTVSIRRASDNVLVDQFVTGADGNYYFDVVPGDYIISVEDALGRVAVEDTLTPAGFLQNFRTEWTITADFFKIWDYDANLEVPLSNVTNAPFSFGGVTTPYHVQNINFLLDPEDAPAPQAQFTGTVFADTNGDGTFNSNDTVLPNARVFADVNRNGEFDSGEILTTTNASGQYTLTVPIAASSVINVGVIPPANWTNSEPDTGFQSFFVEFGDVETGVDFYVQPPAVSTIGDGTANSGIVLGFVFNDINGDGTRQANEGGVSNTTVYIDMNNSNGVDAGDIVTQTNSNGAYVFAGVPNGNHLIRLNLDPALQLTQTFPTANLPQFVSITAGDTEPNIRFGVRAPVTGGSLDFGDLPNGYGTTLTSNGARHPKGIFFLGTSVDSEVNGVPTADALGDDVAFTDDEDGITVAPLVAGGTGALQAVASRNGGFLQGWVDFNGDGDFNDTIDGVSERIVTNVLLATGQNTVNFAIPSTILASTVYARFRYGEFGLGLLGLAQIGEVEDYVLAKAGPVVPLVIGHGPDFNNDGEVSGFDFLAWQAGYGTTQNATPNDGDSDGNGTVNGLDLADWVTEYSSNAASGASGQVGAYQADGGDPSAQLAEGEALSPQLNAEFESSSSSVQAGAPADASAATGQTDSTTSSAVASRGPASASISVDSSSTQSAPSPVVSGAARTSSVRNTATLASLASEAHRQFRHAVRFDRDGQDFMRRARIENETVETSFRDSVDLTDLGFVMRDRALDRMFGRREKLMEQLPWNREDDKSDSADALEAVLGEEIEWRFS